jgi:galactokinase
VNGEPVPHDMRVADLVAAFEREYGRPTEGIAEAPGRVNLIGEHVDYNDGLVLPLAIDRSVLCAWSRVHPTIDDNSRVRSRNLAKGSGEQDVGGAGTATFYSVDLNDMEALEAITAGAVEWDATRNGDWADYPSGVLWALVAAGYATRGIDVAIAGDVPQGAGLSSSAALEVAVAGALRDAFELPMGDVDLTLLCQRAENEYVGVRCGIMDQFAATFSRRSHALLLDCRSLAYEHVPLRLETAGLSIVIADSAVSRELASSAYNDRRRECEQAVAELRVRLARPSLKSLRDVTEDQMRSIDGDSVPMRRARHVVGEIARVREAVESLRRDDFGRLGELMRASHSSLRDDYEVSSPQLDLLVELASARPYVLGSRLTGAGFGGCTVSLVRTEAVDAFGRDVIEPYRQETGLSAVMYVTSACDGLRTWRV